MILSRARRDRRGSSLSSMRGFTTPEALVGAAVGLIVIVAALTLSSGMLRLGRQISQSADDALATEWALDRIARDLARSGVGVDPFGDPSCPDEAVEITEREVFGVRADLDGDDRLESQNPESDLAGFFPLIPTANDEVVLYLRRTASGGGSGRALFDADMDSSDRVLLGDGTLLARRDGATEQIDAGPFAREGQSAGVLYRVTFVHEATRFGTGRFRVLQPLLDDVSRFHAVAYDENGLEVPSCGGADDPASRTCRERVRGIDVTIGTGRSDVTRSLRLARSNASSWVDE